MRAPLPIRPAFGFLDVDEYVASLLHFITSEDLFQKLCGGVHILDFLTQEPDLYTTLLPESWAEWFHGREISEVLDLVMREQSLELECLRTNDLDQCTIGWRGGPSPPTSLIDYILSIRKYSLDRRYIRRKRRKDPRGNKPGHDLSLPQHVAVGMKSKKIHEVENFAEYIHDLIVDIDESESHKITHVIDFGSGQNYLGRALASPPLCKRVVALESKQHNIKGAKTMDVAAKLVKKEKIIRNKKVYRHGSLKSNTQSAVIEHSDCTSDSITPKYTTLSEKNGLLDGTGSIDYIEKFIADGDLSDIVTHIESSANTRTNVSETPPQLMVMSLHSCGNLLHHGVRSLILNPTVKAIAMVGCCYNLVTERLGPPTYKLPSLRSSHPRLQQTSSAYDPHGFPMSEKMASYQHHRGRGIRLNITARMMAVQAPENWTSTECESFFTRHFYRAVLQRILLDRGVVGKPVNSGVEETSPQGWTGAGPALTIGSLRKACYTSFVAYVRGAVAKLAVDPDRGTDIARRMENLTDEAITSYETKYQAKKKELSIVWSLMAFSASVVEATILTDRWLYLKEQKEVKDAWVETVFDYKQSPRNLVVVGIKY
ncbi:hypothetical protein ACLMJK_001219 [Lecanora helva]